MPPHSRTGFPGLEDLAERRRGLVEELVRVRRESDLIRYTENPLLVLIMGLVPATRVDTPSRPATTP